MLTLEAIAVNMTRGLMRQYGEFSELFPSL